MYTVCIRCGYRLCIHLETQDSIEKNSEEQDRLELAGILNEIDNEKVRAKFESFINMREKNHSPLTPDAIRILIKKLMVNKKFSKSRCSNHYDIR